jgi:hypothetical protein
MKTMDFETFATANGIDTQIAPMGATRTSGCNMLPLGGGVNWSTLKSGNFIVWSFGRDRKGKLFHKVIKSGGFSDWMHASNYAAKIARNGEAARPFTPYNRRPFEKMA